jgi:E3 ubiquitin-protein ligase HUWE1
MLLNTFDIDVLEQVLHFMIRPAQRINNPRAIRSSFVVPQDKIIELARGWNNVPAELLRIAQDLKVTPKMTTLNIQFYRTMTSASSTTTATTNAPTTSTSTVAAESSTINHHNEATTTVTEGHQVVSYLITDEDMKKDDIDIFLKLVKEHDIPKEYQFELANRIRIAKHMKQPDVRRKLLGIRILAICIMCK